MEKSLCSRGAIVTTDEESENSTYHNEGCTKLNVYNWYKDIPNPPLTTDIVEVQFKNTRKAFFRNSNGLPLKEGDMVAVESSPGHDIGTVTLTGWLVNKQLKKAGIDPEKNDIKKVYRKAKPADIEKLIESIALENSTMVRTRQIITELNLNMKLGDVEYQGDKTKAVFYYIADERVDFRELIKILAEEFQIRVEMRQIGARQEAGRIGGIGSCGRELCCSSWINNFVSVTTNSARTQELSLNPLKLAGQCGKLKCCLNYEVDTYADARKDFPKTTILLETTQAIYQHQKTDVHKRVMWYSSDAGSNVNLTAVPIDRVKEVIELNSKGKKLDNLVEEVVEEGVAVEMGYGSAIEENSLTRFDEKKASKAKKRRKGRRKPKE